MRAAIITEYGMPLEIANVPDPVLPRDGIIMKVRATGVCRSDWHTWMGHYGDQINLPLIPGHEMAGDVLEVVHGSFMRFLHAGIQARNVDLLIRGQSLQ